MIFSWGHLVVYNDCYETPYLRNEAAAYWLVGVNKIVFVKNTHVCNPLTYVYEFKFDSR